MNLSKFPKIELHLHLDGSVRPSTVSNILNLNKKDVEKEMIVDTSCNDLNDYLTKFDLPLTILQTKNNLIKVSEELANDLKKDGIIYAEIRFAPILHTNNGLSCEEVIEAVIEGISMVDIKINLIICLMRNVSEEDNYKVINAGLKYINNRVVGFDLAGAEAIYKTSNFKELFKYISKYNIPFTIHAGEADGIDSIKSAIEFGAKRIGHGVRIMDNINMIKYAKDNNITFEVCPTSNIDTKIYKEYKEHAIKKMYDNNLNITINTDNRTVSNITLTEEYNKLINTFNFSLEDIKNMNITAINASFISDIDKENLKQEYILKYNKFIKNGENNE